MFTHNAHNAGALTPDFSQHGNMRADSQYIGNKVTLLFWKSNSVISFYIKK